MSAILPTTFYADARDDIRSGDILLCSGNSVFSGLIKQATGSEWSHVGFVLRLDAIDRIMVLESVESIGVRAMPLSNYINNYNGTGKGYDGKMMIARHDDFHQKNIVNLSRFAVDLLGHPYHTQEIADIAARISRQSLGLPGQAPDKGPLRTFICSEYAHLCFKSVGITIEYNEMGFIAPEDFVRDSKVKPLYFIATAEEMRATQAA